MIRKITAAAVLPRRMWILSGCHTDHGVGQDIEGSGRAIERSSGKGPVNKGKEGVNMRGPVSFILAIILLITCSGCFLGAAAAEAR
jgi:predicted small secreted protein